MTVPPPAPVLRIADQRFPILRDGRAIRIALLGPEVRKTHSLHIVPGVGHDHRVMFMSSCGLSLLFGDGRCHSL